LEFLKNMKNPYVHDRKLIKILVTLFYYSHLQENTSLKPTVLEKPLIWHLFIATYNISHKTNKNFK